MLADKGYDSKMGARPLSRKIDELIRVPLSKKILFERLDNCHINAVMIDDKIDFTIIPSDPLPMIDSNGIIVLGNASPQV
jgi:ATP-dependent Clp protease ATP-binding subunit ClpA